MACKDNVRPLHQDIRLNLDPYRPDYDGKTVLRLAIDEPTNRLTLNSVGHAITNVRLQAGPDSQHVHYRDLPVDFNAAAQTATITLPAPVVGEVLLFLDFAGKVSEGMVGLYGCDYTEVASGEKKRLLCTQFETVHAREAFPCFDAPRFKPTYQFLLEVPAGMTALCGPDVDTRIPSRQGYDLVTFAPYPPSPSYTTAIVVGDLESIENYTDDGVRVRVWTTKGQVWEGEFALGVATTAIEKLSEWHDFPYKKMLPKIDHVALPKFAFGAMENLGLVTYREAGLLVKAGRTPLARKMYVAEVIVHETNHMWDGNWVTPKTWADTWLNESFTTLLQFLITDRLFPEWKLWEKFTQEEVGPALKLAALKSTHSVAIDREVSDDESNTIFDAVSYNQGAAIARMVMGALGEDGLQKALRLYVQRFGGGCANADDMYAILDEVDPTGVAAATMRNWTRQAGYPVIMTDASNKTSDRIALRQKRFFKDQEAFRAQEGNRQWVVPLPVRFDDGSTELSVIEKETALLPGNQSFLLNADRAVPARMAYDPLTWFALECDLDKLAASDVNRAMVIGDAYAVTFVGLQPVSDCLGVIDRTANDPDFDHSLQTWRAITDTLQSLEFLASSRPRLSAAIRKTTSELVDPPLKTLGLTPKEDEPVDDTLLRTSLLLAGVDADNEAVLDYCLSLWDGGAPINPNLLTAVFQSVAKRKGIDPLIERYRRETSEDLQTRLLIGMTSAATTGDLQRLLAFAMTPEVRLMHISMVIDYVSVNPVGLKLAWETLKASWPELLKRHGEDNMSLVRYIQIVKSMTTPEMIANAEAFFAENRPKGTDRSVAEIFEATRANLAWADLNLADLAKFMTDLE